MNSSSGQICQTDAHQSLAVAATGTGVQRRMSNGEILRKILHISPGLIPFLMQDMPHEDPLDTAALCFLCVVSVILTIVFLAVFRLVRRPGEDNLFSTTISYPATVVGSIILFPSHLEFACVVVVVLAFGDGSAFLFGRYLGKKKLPWNSGKTWLGTIAFVAVSGPLAALAYWIEAKPEVGAISALACGLGAAAAGAIAESIDVKVTDNLRVGTAALIAVFLISLLVT